MSKKREQPDFPVAELLRWYRRHRRDLPWRPRPRKKVADGFLPAIKADPYHVLVSEAMAQQTQIATVLPYFARFIEAFPSVAALAEADEQEVLRLWQGLGYYRRARNLRAAARHIVEHHGGEVPRTVEALLQLPGVGRYTAGAIASVAFGVAAPIVDGNVARVIARFDGIETPTNDTPTQKVLWARAEQLVRWAPKRSAGDFNQALMELGALVCVPAGARAACLVCPLREACVARATGRVEVLPRKTPKKKPVAVTHRVLAIERRGKWLLEQRPATGLWSNMWQLPTLEFPGAVGVGFSPPSGRGRGRVLVDGASSAGVGETERPGTLPQPLPEGGELEAWVRERFGLVVGLPSLVEAFVHQTTHRTIRFEVYRAAATGGRLRPGCGQWRSLQKIADLPLAKPQTMALAALARREAGSCGGRPRV